jgi:hypothetical protein
MPAEGEEMHKPHALSRDEAQMAAALLREHAQIKFAKAI